MNKKSRKTKVLSYRLLSALLCCVCLLMATPAYAIASEAGPAPAAEEAAAENPAERAAAETEVREAAAPAEAEEIIESAGISDGMEPAEEAPAWSQLCELFERLMACETFEELSALLDSLTGEERALLEQFTPEQSAALEAKIDELSACAAEAEEIIESAEISDGMGQAEEVSAWSQSDELFERLMVCETFEELDAALNSLTGEEQELLDQFTAEQNAALEARMQELGGYAVEPLTDRSYTIAQGGTQSVTISSMSSSNFSYGCDPEADITAAVTSSWGSASGYTISVGSGVAAGTYTLTVNYETTSGWWGGTTASNTDIVTITVTRSGNYLTVINNMTNVDVVYFKIENDVVTEEFASVRSGSAMEITLPSTSDAIAFFIKPKDGYLLTSFYRDEGGVVDLYSVETAAADCNFRYFKNNTDTGDDILTKAKKAGYLGYYGFTGPSGSGYTGTFVEVAEAPQMSISAQAYPNTDLKPGDKVTFTITVTPGDLSTGADYTIEDKTITSLTINGVSYTAEENEDGTYSVDYEITEEDWAAKKATLDVTASLTYNYVVPVTDRNGVTGNIRTEATITSSATTDCTFATKQGVLYQLSYDAPSGVNPPLDTSLDDYIPAAPVDGGEYFDGAYVDVMDYDRSEVDDPANKGTWTFTGWENGGRTGLQAGDSVEMAGGGLLFTGVWKFISYPNADLTIRKTVSGNMQDTGKTFVFTVSADRDMTFDGETGTSFTFSLKKDEEVTISVPVGADVTVSEDASGYTHSLGAGTTITDYTELEDGTGIQFTMPNEDSVVEFNNAKDVAVDTGVVLDSLPYVLILAAAVIGGVIVMKKRRRRDED